MIARIVLLILFLGVGLNPAFAQTTPITLFRDTESLTIYISGDEPVSLTGLELDVETTRPVSAESYAVESYQGFIGVTFDHMTLPTCLRFQLEWSRMPAPLVCQSADIYVQPVTLADVFWFDELTNTDRVILIYSGEDLIDLCPSSNPQCDITFTPTASTQSSPQTSTVRPIFNPNTSCRTIGERPNLGVVQGSTVGRIVEENFQHGRMIWREPIDLGQALVLYSNCTWQIFTHTQYNDQIYPEYSCLDANTPASSPPTPRRGFGKMWCEIAGLRPSLGNAVDYEYEVFNVVMESFQHGFTIHGNQNYVFEYGNSTFSGMWTQR